MYRMPPITSSNKANSPPSSPPGLHVCVVLCTKPLLALFPSPTNLCKLFCLVCGVCMVCGASVCEGRVCIWSLLYTVSSQVSEIWICSSLAQCIQCVSGESGHVTWVWAERSVSEWVAGRSQVKLCLLAQVLDCPYWQLELTRQERVCNFWTTHQ